MLPEYGEIYWDEEEACFLRLSRDFDGFYDELREVTLEFLEQRGITVPVDELDDVLRYQRLAMPRADSAPQRQDRFGHRVHEYFEALFSTTPQPLAAGTSIVRATQPHFASDLPRFARESILWGRKSGTMLAVRAAEPTPETAELESTACHVQQA